MRRRPRKRARYLSCVCTGAASSCVSVMLQMAKSPYEAVHLEHVSGCVCAPRFGARLLHPQKNGHTPELVSNRRYLRRGILAMLVEGLEGLTAERVLGLDAKMITDRANIRCVRLKQNQRVPVSISILTTDRTKFRYALLQQRKYVACNVCDSSFGALGGFHCNKGRV